MVEAQHWGSRGLGFYLGTQLPLLPPVGPLSGLA